MRFDYEAITSSTQSFWPASICCGDFSGNKSKAIATLWTNGWHRYSTKPIDIYLVNADHDSIMKNENAHVLSDIFAHIFK